jgi:dUTP pyrophosphatase
MKLRGFEKISIEQWQKDTNEISYSSIILPKRSTAKSAGYDIFSTIDFTLNPNEEIKIPTGIKSYMPENEFTMIIPRSGLGFKYYTRLANTIGIVDSDYYNNLGNEGHYWVKIRNEGSKELSIKSGEAIAQIIFQQYLLVDGDNFDGNERVGGFGSTS